MYSLLINDCCLSVSSSVLNIINFLFVGGELQFHLLYQGYVF